LRAAPILADKGWVRGILLSAALALLVCAQAGARQQPVWVGPGTPLSAYALAPNPNDASNPPREVRVGAGQSLFDIATLYQVPMLALIERNHLEPPYALAPGAIIQLPPPNVHVVREGERFEDIARAYNVDLHSLGALNRMAAPYGVRPGDRIVLPAGARGGDGEATEEEPRDKPREEATREVPAPSSVARGASLQAAEPLDRRRFAWPLRGAIVARFGAQMNGARLDGIEIAGSEGDAIDAAADGDVVYAGSDLAAYGTLVLVRHEDNYVTAYGFARRALVREGEHVRAGQAVAELGSRPDGRARLLFQVRQGAHAVDPAPLLGMASN
jgi:murein DD-endopeptidase MepM/ murein hydrolase activator NlpD